MKRIVIATLFGLAAGAICAAGTFYAGMLKFSVVALVWILLNRAVMGFAIGVSALKLHWAWNGVAVGLVVGSIFSYSLFMDAGAGWLALINAAVNGVFGLLIELFTTVVFKQPAVRRARLLAVERSAAA